MRQAQQPLSFNRSQLAFPLPPVDFVEVRWNLLAWPPRVATTMFRRLYAFPLCFRVKQHLALSSVPP